MGEDGSVGGDTYCRSESEEGVAGGRCSTRSLADFVAGSRADSTRSESVVTGPVDSGRGLDAASGGVAARCVTAAAERGRVNLSNGSSVSLCAIHRNAAPNVAINISSNRGLLIYLSAVTLTQRYADPYGGSKRSTSQYRRGSGDKKEVVKRVRTLSLAVA